MKKFLTTATFKVLVCLATAALLVFGVEFFISKEIHKRVEAKGATFSHYWYDGLTWTLEDVVVKNPKGYKGELFFKKAEVFKGRVSLFGGSGVIDIGDFKEGAKGEPKLLKEDPGKGPYVNFDSLRVISKDYGTVDLKDVEFRSLSMPNIGYSGEIEGYQKMYQLEADSAQVVALGSKVVSKLPAGLEITELPSVKVLRVTHFSGEDVRAVLKSIKVKAKFKGHELPIYIENINAGNKGVLLAADVIDIGGYLQLKKSLITGGQLTAGELIVNHPWVSAEPVTFRDFKLDDFEDSGGKYIKASLGGEFSGVKAYVPYDLSKVIVKSSGPSLLKALPDSKPDIFSGTPILTGGEGVFYDPIEFAAYLERKEIRFWMNSTVDCTEFNKLKKPFTYMTYAKDGKTRVPRTTGPGTSDWVDLKHIGEDVYQAFVTLEDPSFFRHRGYLSSSLSVAFQQNVQKGEFFRGGSTITQQMVKNVYLNRDKTLLRKGYELILASAIENCLTKEEILETYLNVIEFAPDTYGIYNGARHWFHVDPVNLNLDEAFFLATLLPHPSKVTPPEKGGLEKARKIMERLKVEPVGPSEEGLRLAWDTW